MERLYNQEKTACLLEAIKLHQVKLPSLRFSGQWIYFLSNCRCLEANALVSDDSALFRRPFTHTPPERLNACIKCWESLRIASEQKSLRLNEPRRSDVSDYWLESHLSSHRGYIFIELTVEFLYYFAQSRFQRICDCHLLNIDHTFALKDCKYWYGLPL